MERAETVTLPAVAIKLPPTTLTKWEREYRVFLRLLPRLLQTHQGQYVAIHKEQFTDAAGDKIILVKRVLQRIGSQDFHVGLVTDEPAPLARVPHYRAISACGESA